MGMSIIDLPSCSVGTPLEQLIKGPVRPTNHCIPMGRKQKQSLSFEQFYLHVGLIELHIVGLRGWWASGKADWKLTIEGELIPSRAFEIQENLRKWDPLGEICSTTNLSGDWRQSCSISPSLCLYHTQTHTLIAQNKTLRLQPEQQHQLCPNYSWIYVRTTSCASGF